MKTVKNIGRPFRKGASGNPGGRPRLEGSIRELAQAHSHEAMERLVSLLHSADERVAMSAVKYLLDRAWGPPSQTIEVVPPAKSRPLPEEDKKLMDEFFRQKMAELGIILPSCN